MKKTASPTHNTWWLMSEANKELKRLHKEQSKARKPRKQNYFPAIESYCMKKQWVTRHFDANTFTLKYSFCNGFVPTKAHIKQIVEALK